MFIGLLLNYYRTSIEPLLNHIEHLLNIYHYQTSIKLLLNMYQILIVQLYNHYLFILITEEINETY